MRRLGKAPDVIHCNDWQSGFACVELRRLRRREGFFAQTRILFSIHNLAYQGLFSPSDLWWLGFTEEANDFMLSGAASALKAGIIATDALSTVSPRYAREIQTPEQGYQLDWLIRARRKRLVGITNGVDYEVWNPETDPHTAAHFCATRGGAVRRECAGRARYVRDVVRRLVVGAQR